MDTDDVTKYLSPQDTIAELLRKYPARASEMNLGMGVILAAAGGAGTFYGLGVDPQFLIDMYGFEDSFDNALLDTVSILDWQFGRFGSGVVELGKNVAAGIGTVIFPVGGLVGLNFFSMGAFYGVRNPIDNKSDVVFKIPEGYLNHTYKFSGSKGKLVAITNGPDLKQKVGSKDHGVSEYGVFNGVEPSTFRRSERFNSNDVTTVSIKVGDESVMAWASGTLRKTLTDLMNDDERHDKSLYVVGPVGEGGRVGHRRKTDNNRRRMYDNTIELKDVGPAMLKD